MNNFIKDENYDKVSEKLGTELADIFFSYLYSEHHFNPGEILQFIPDFYECLDKFLENCEPDVHNLKQFIDEQLIQYYQLLNRRY